MNRSEDHRELQTETDLAQATGQLQDTQCNPFSPIPQRKPGDWKLAKFSLTNDEIDLTQLWPKPAPLPSCSCSLSFLAPEGDEVKRQQQKVQGYWLGPELRAKAASLAPPAPVLYHPSLPEGSEVKRQQRQGEVLAASA
ncbi:hypothetical protein H4I95_07667 [Botrytis cinerea]